MELENLKAAALIGYSKLKPEHEQAGAHNDVRTLCAPAIVSFISGNDVFVALPTECGKSLCFDLLGATPSSFYCYKCKLLS